MEPFEIRQYPSYLLAEVNTLNNTDGKADTGPAFRLLANYIGVFG